MKKVILLAAVLSLGGCGWFDRVVASTTGSSEACIDGVKYIQFASGVTVKYTRDGKVANCN